MLTTDQTNTILKTLMIFIENRDPFTIESIVNEIKRNGDQYDGFYDDKGSCIVEDYYLEISEMIDKTIRNLYHEWVDDVETVYVFRPAYVHSEDDEYDEVEDLDDINVDKEGNRLPDREEVYDDTKDDLIPGEYRDQNGEIDWDRDAAESARYEEGDFENYGQKPKVDEEEYHDPDHPIIFEMKVDKQKRINIKKDIFEEAKWKPNEEVIIIGNETDHSQFFIIRKSDFNKDYLQTEEYIIGEYKLKNSSFKLNVNNILNDIKGGEKLHAKIIWVDGYNYINVGFDID